MKRSEALAPLSCEHHQALVAAQRLRRATPDTAQEARDAFLAFWESHGRRHFRIEEEVLFPAYAGYGDPHDALLLRALGDHVAIRRDADAIAAAATPEPDALIELGDRLHAHVRLEERELFPLIEETVPGGELTALAEALARAEQP